MSCCVAPGKSALCRKNGADGGRCPSISVITQKPAKRTEHHAAGDDICSAPGSQPAVTTCGDDESNPNLAKSQLLRGNQVPREDVYGKKFSQTGRGPNCYKQNRPMSCGPTCAAEMIYRLNGKKDLTPQDLGELLKDAHHVGAEWGTKDEALDTHGFEGYGFENAINKQTLPKKVKWHDEKDAVYAAQHSSRESPVMLVVNNQYAQHWILSFGMDGKDSVVFCDPDDGGEWAVPLSDVKKGMYTEQMFFKNNGFLGLDE